MPAKLNCIMLIDDRLTNFINKIIIDEVGCSEHVVKVLSAEKALNYLKDSGRTSD